MSLVELNASASLIASLLARTASALQHAHYDRALTRLHFALDRIDAAEGVLPGDGLVRAAEALAVIAQGQESA